MPEKNYAKDDTRHMQKVRGAADRSINEPADPSARMPSARAKVEITTPARHAGRTMSRPRSSRSGGR